MEGLEGWDNSNIDGNMDQMTADNYATSEHHGQMPKMPAFLHQGRVQAQQFMSNSQLGRPQTTQNNYQSKISRSKSVTRSNVLNASQEVGQGGFKGSR